KEVRRTEVCAAIWEAGIVPFVEILPGHRQVVRHLSLGRYLAYRQEHFLGFDARAGHRLHAVGRSLRVGNRMRTEQQPLPPIVGMPTDLQVDRGLSDAEV